MLSARAANGNIGKDKEKFSKYKPNRVKHLA